MKTIKNEADLAKRLSSYLKAHIDDAGLTYAEVAERLSKHGLSGETGESVRAKLKRGTFPATFMIALAAVLGLTQIDVRRI